MRRDAYYLPTRRLVSQDDAAITERPNVPRSRFTGSWTRKMAFDAGYIVPFMLDEVLPGDHLSYNVTAYVRMSTPLFPLFDNQRIDTFFFFVPARILWTNWKMFMGETYAGAPIDALLIPQIFGTVGGDPVGSIFDHMGIPVLGQVGVADGMAFNALPFRAYNKIYMEWFMDQNINTVGAPTHTGDGPDPTSSYVLRRRAKSHDYFTSALPWPQKFIAPSVPVAGIAPIVGLGTLADASSVSQAGVFETDNPTAQTYAFYQTGNTTDWKMEMTAATGGRPMVFADLSAATGVAVNTFRQAFLVQQLLERDARGGTRYTELIRSHFGVTNPDLRVQRPEYIGGGQSPLQITPVAQTAPSTELPVGALGAAGTSVGQHRASYAATEHGYILGLINVRTELSYQQGLHRMWRRRTRYDFYFPSLAGLGEQAVLREELYATGFDDTDLLVFGYQERWHELRTRTSEVTGIMRSTAAGTLDMWHLSQHFTAAPTLSQAFIEDTPDMERVLAAGAESEGQQYLADILIERNAVRPIPTFGTPAIFGRF